MRKFLLTILVLITVAAAWAQPPVVKPQQYKVLIERTVSKNPNGKCYTYTQNPSPGLYVVGCIGEYPGYDGRTDYQGWCMVEDPNCHCGTNNNSLSIQVYKGGLLTNTSIPNISLAGLSNGVHSKVL